MERKTILVFSATRRYRHESIPTSIRSLRAMEKEWPVHFQFTEEKEVFNSETLEHYAGVLFVLNSGEVLDETGQTALHRFCKNGGAFIGVHSAAACMKTTKSYVETLGAPFDYHPELMHLNFLKTENSHPATDHLPTTWCLEEELYYFSADPRVMDASVILTVDPSFESYIPGARHGWPHPVAWCIDRSQSRSGRTFYTALGHLSSTWENPDFLRHLMVGVMWAVEP